MKNAWLHTFSGSVTVSVSGKEIERFLNELIRAGAWIWNVKRVDSDRLTFEIGRKDIPVLIKARRSVRVKVVFSGRRGLPFRIRSWKKYSGSAFGILLGVLLLFLLSNILWSIEIRGASPEMEKELKRRLDDYGIRIGKFQFLMESPEKIQERLMKTIDGLTWVGVEQRGTTIRFEVVEKTLPEAERPPGPRHLVAKKEAVIVDYFIEKGLPVIRRNQFVKPGQLLVSGMIGTENSPRIVAAEGVVWGKTWYKTEVSVKMKTEIPFLTGASEERIYLAFGNFRVPIWGFRQKNFARRQQEESETELKFLGYHLPISIVKKKTYEVKTEWISYNEEEAEKQALIQARRDLAARLPEEADVKEEKVLHETVENGTLKMSILFEVIENIAEGQPIAP